MEEANHKGVGASSLGYGQTIVSSSPIDVNLAKQLNILLGNLGVNSDKIIIDPTTGGLGYGMEYSYSVMERIMMAALTQEDDKLQIPMICNLGNEIWKCKEAKEAIEEAPTLGDPEKRGIMMESTAAVCYLLAGASIVILRHPESVRLTKSFIELLSNGGTAAQMWLTSPRFLILKRLIFFLFLRNPTLILRNRKPKRNRQPRRRPHPKLNRKPEAKAEVKEAPKAAPAPKVEAKAGSQSRAVKAAPKEDPEAKAKAEAEAKARQKPTLKRRQTSKVAAEAKAKAEAEAKVKAEADSQGQSRSRSSGSGSRQT